jgi:hypothetical protein
MHQTGYSTIRHTMCRIIFLTVVLWIALASVAHAPAPAHAQLSDDQLGESILFVIAFPQLRQLPPPLWFRPGVRVTYEVGSANFQGGGAGGGIVQYDVVGLDIGQGVVSAQNFCDTGLGVLVPLGGVAKVGLPAVGEIWINPVVLVNAEAVAHQSLSVTRRNELFNGQTIQVVRFQSDNTGGRIVWEFDAATGLRLMGKD